MVNNKDMMKEKYTTPRVVVAGNIGVDISPMFNDGSIIHMGELLRPGQIVQISGDHVYPGGSVANTGLAMNLMGVKATLVGKVGCDSMGEMLKSMVAKKEVPVIWIEEAGSYTAYSIILVPKTLDRIILQNPGANDLLDWLEIIDAIDSIEGSGGLFHFGHPPAMRMMYENQGEDLVNLFCGTKERCMVNSLDMCAVDPESSAGAKNWRKILMEVLPYIDLFMPSFEELQYMLRVKGWEKCGLDAMSLDKVAITAEYMIECAQTMGARTVVIKCGEKGMYYATGDKKHAEHLEKCLGFEPGTLAEWVNKRGHVEAKKVKRYVSGLGAGDVSIAALLAALLEGGGPEKAVERAVTAGALCVTGYDALSGLEPKSF